MLGQISDNEPIIHIFHSGKIMLMIFIISLFSHLRHAANAEICPQIFLLQVYRTKQVSVLREFSFLLDIYIFDLKSFHSKVILIHQPLTPNSGWFMQADFIQPR